MQWADLDLANCRLSIRRTLDTTARDTVKLTKTGGARVIDLDSATIAALKAWRVHRGSVSLQLTGARSFVFGNWTE